jgi:hypothetical protein
MEQHYPIVDQINLIAAQLRLLADLTLERDNLQGIDPDAMALVLQDLAARLAQIARASENSIDSPLELCEGRR